jgi:DNA modification methylase
MAPSLQQNAAPTLHWPGRRPAAPVEASRPALVESFEPLHRNAPPLWDAASLPAANRLYLGDNLPLLQRLVDTEERFHLIYADPPYGSGALWTRKVRLRGPQRDLGRRVLARLPEYSDTLDDAGYLQFMHDRLLLLRELLEESGTLWIHCDYRHAHTLRLLGDEIFGGDNWLNSITWRSQTARGAKANARYFPHSAHTLHIFARNARARLTWNAPRRRYILSEAEAEAEFMRDEGGFFRTSDPGSYTFESLKRLHGEGRLYAPYGGVVLVDDERRRVYCSHGGNIGVKYYLTDLGKGRHQVERTVDNIWDDIPGLGTTPGEDTGYPTQKTAALLERIVATATNPGDRVLDPFTGSGTTLVTAQRLGRRWVGIDAGPGALRIARSRLIDCIEEQRRAGDEAPPLDPAAARFDILAAGPPPPARPSPSAEETGAAPSVDLLITRNALDPSRIQVTIAAFRAPAVDALLDGVVVDWRALVDSICIDPAWDGGPFRFAVADAPARRTRTVGGAYDLQLPDGAHAAGLPVAIRLTDILGGETVVTFDPAPANHSA